MTEQVSKSQGLTDGIQAAARYITVIITVTVAALGLLKVHDIAGIIALIQSNGGQVLAAISGLIGLGTAAYGVLKSKKRGTQVAEAAAVPQVKSLELEK